MKITITEDEAVSAEAKATPLNPKSFTKIGVSAQVKTVHMTMRVKLFLMCPVALSVLVKVVVIEAQSAFTPKSVRDNTAGCHLSYLGII